MQIWAERNFLRGGSRLEIGRGVLGTIRAAAGLEMALSGRFGAVSCNVNTFGLNSYSIFSLFYS